MSKLSKTEMENLLDEYLDEILEDSELERTRAPKPMSEDELDDHLFVLSSLCSDAREDLALNNYKGIRRYVEGLLNERGIQLEKNSEEYLRLCRDLLKVHVRALEIDQKRAVGDYGDEAERFLTFRNRQEDKKPEALGEPLSEIIKMYRSEQKQGGNWTEKTENENLAILNTFTEIVGDIPVKTVGYEQIRHYKQALMRLPANRHKSQRYRNKSIAEILSMKNVKPMATNTINKNLNRVSSFLKYAVKNGFMDKNPAESMQIATGRRDDEYRDIFATGDLESLFRSNEYLEDSHRHPYCFWMPILGLFTGARLEELAQLNLDDIRQEDDVFVIDINNRGEKSVKTKAALRIIPIHPFLQEELQFVKYVKSLKAKGEQRLFPELEKLRDGYGQRVSKWFGRYKKRCGIIEQGKKKDFHSFRHTFADTLKQNRKVDPYMISELVGHSVDSMTMGRYGKRYNAQALFDAIKTLDYGIDLSHLKRSKYVLGSF